MVGNGGGCRIGGFQGAQPGGEGSAGHGCDPGMEFQLAVSHVQAHDQFIHLPRRGEVSPDVEGAHGGGFRRRLRGLKGLVELLLDLGAEGLYQGRRPDLEGGIAFHRQDRRQAGHGRRTLADVGGGAAGHENGAGLLEIDILPRGAGAVRGDEVQDAIGCFARAFPPGLAEIGEVVLALVLDRQQKNPATLVRSVFQQEGPQRPVRGNSHPRHGPEHVVQQQGDRLAGHRLGRGLAQLEGGSRQIVQAADFQQAQHLRGFNGPGR